MTDTQTEIQLKFVTPNNPILSQPCQPWSAALGIDPESLVKEMMTIMILNKGIGLAAPQVGVDARVFVMGTAELSYACFNPRIVEVSNDRVVAQEGCLTYPGLYLNIKRPSWVKAEFENASGDTQQTTFSGIMCTVFLHELDHLYGIQFVDKSSKLGVQLAKRRINKNLKKQGIK